MGKIPCTVYVLTMNSEAVLVRALDSVRDFAEILVCDGNSTDRTLDIARQYGARIIKQSDSTEPNKKIEDFAAVRNRCIIAARFDWILQLDSDERVGPEIVNEIRDIVARPVTHHLYQVSCRLIFRGREIRHAASYPGYQIRFLNKRCGAMYVRNPHSRFEYDTEKYSVGYLRFPWYVFDEGEEGFRKQYADIEASALSRLPLMLYIRWGIFNRTYRILKILAKIALLYGRYGFKDTLPPPLEFVRVRYAWAVMYGAFKNRLSRTA